MRPLLALAGLFLAVALLVAAAPPSSAPKDQPRGIIAFSSLAPRHWDVYVLDVKTRHRRRLTDHVAAPCRDQNVTVRCRLLLGSASTARPGRGPQSPRRLAMTSFMISFVPPPIPRIRASL